ncbi:alanine--tRNA ligase, mitochondrial-like, partial [Leptopilina heterotoma]|uniref:alanine--tRNA ligase, mitochondrial-like n=1 Tax=Leptopilina heterotoma TaxID=63436 RepID=UPI001CA8E75A
EEACKYAWNLLTDVYGINKDLLYVTYYSGDEKLGLKPDLECKDIWLRLGVPENHILAFGTKDNFWEMSSTGPCGVCTEIHISEDVNKPVNLIELWNIVFIQHERLNDGSIISLPKHHVDTGMGFERLVATLQGKKSNYDTDLFVPLFQTIQKFAKAPAYKENENLDVNYRILADHARMVTVALADGALPDNNQKLRRVLRKALDISNEVFKKDVLLHELTFHVAESLGEAYPELHKNIKQMQHIIDYETHMYYSLRNTTFIKWKNMIDGQCKLASLSNDVTPGLILGYQDLKKFLSGKKLETLPGEFAFRLYDTHGLNVKIISKLAEVESLKFNVSDFEEELNKVKARSKARTEGKKDMETISDLSLNLFEKSKVPKTDDSYKYNYIPEKKGYSFPTVKSKLLGFIINGKLKISPEVNNCHLEKDELRQSEVYIVLDKTPFYVNEGGQAFDNGFIQIKNLLFDIYEVRKIRGYVFHVGHLINNDSRKIPLNELELNIRNEEISQVWINSRRRLSIMRNHTATHLLNAALRRVLPTIEQRGSYVEKDKLTFECSVFGQKLNNERITKIENLVNKCIESDVPVQRKTVNMSEMMMEDDLRIIPGEMYPMTGIKITSIDSPDLKSKEACCGTHVHRTSILDHFCILYLKSQGKISVTIEAATGPFTRYIRLSGEQLRDKVLGLEEALSDKNANLDVIADTINNLNQNLSLRKDKRLISFVVYRECQDKLSELSKKMETRGRGKLREYLETKIKEEQKSNNLPFVILHLRVDDYEFNGLPLSKLDVITDVPTLIILSSDTAVKARCMVPKEIYSDSFNADVWTKPLLQLFKTSKYYQTNKNSNLICGMSMQKMSRRKSEMLIQSALIKTKEIAHLYFDNNFDKMKANKVEK